MISLRKLGVTLGTIAVTVAPSTAVAATPPTVSVTAELAQCAGAYNKDARLGPESLPAPGDEPVGPLLRDYSRTGNMSPSSFLKKYWEGPSDSGGWKYPPNEGFAEVNGAVDKRQTEMHRGQRLDRFGSERGSYLAPAGDAYKKRALPPQNLNTRDSTAPCDYRAYQVAKPFRVWQGAVAPWFEQPGGGQQIKLDPTFLDPGEGQRLNVAWLLEHHYLTRVGG